MTDYVPTEWTNEAPSASPLKYEIVDDVNGEIAGSATITLQTPVTPGTPVNAANMNHIEQGIEALAAVVAALPGNWVAGLWMSTDWDGDAKSANGSYTIDVNAVFGVPAGARAVLVSITDIVWQTSNSSTAWIKLSTYGLTNPMLIVRGQYYNVHYSGVGLVLLDDGKMVVQFGNNTPTAVTLEIAGYLA